jgi:site-specific DNA recombinase
VASPATNGKKAQRVEQVRCAIYTRKSTTEGLDSDFNTLDAQREAAEHYIKSQAASGWIPLDTRYDDGGFTGGNIDRPALTRLMDDIERGDVNMVVVYKVDRLSRSLLDFTRLMARFEAKGVGFVSITQHFDTSTSMGRLVLNILLSFAQFERELISERTRDKVQAARRRGKWTGGHVVLGYDLDPKGGGLVVVPEEAELVRLVFDLYLRHGSIGVVAEKLNAHGFTQKQRTTRKGRSQGGGPWHKKAVHAVLTNPLYVGRMRGRDGELHVGEHAAIIERDVFERAAAGLDNRSTGRVRGRRGSLYLLSGLLRCEACNAAMTSSFAKGRNGQTYRYYRCVHQQNTGQPCPTGLLSAPKVEAAVVAHLKEVARRPDLRRRVGEIVEAEVGRTRELEAERDEHVQRLADLDTEAGGLLAAFKDAGGGGRLLAGRLAELERAMDGERRRIAEVESRIRTARAGRTRLDRVADLLNGFERIWEVLVPDERRELIRQVVERVSVDVGNGELGIALHDLGREQAEEEARR